MYFSYLLEEHILGFLVDGYFVLIFWLGYSLFKVLNFWRRWNFFNFVYRQYKIFYCWKKIRKHTGLITLINFKICCSVQIIIKMDDCFFVLFLLSFMKYIFILIAFHTPIFMQSFYFIQVNIKKTNCFLTLDILQAILICIFVYE